MLSLPGLFAEIILLIIFYATCQGTNLTYIRELGFLYVALWTVSIMDKLILVSTKIAGEGIC